MILLIDNYDSFTWNLAQVVGALGGDPWVVRNDELDVEALVARDPAGVIVSPGPGVPEQAGVTLDLLRRLDPRIPVLGVCLGHQAIGVAWGGRWTQAPAIMHGKVSSIRHDGQGVYQGIDSPLLATRYHSLVLDRAALPPVLAVTAETEDGVVMGVRHRDRPVEGVQFHPESHLSPTGPRLIANFLRRCAA